MLWLGDFNWHHPMWETVKNCHLNSSDEDMRTLIKLLGDYDMELVLLPGTSTLHTAWNRWTRPDNVWRRCGASDPVVTCGVDPSLCPPITDHMSILTEIELPIQRSTPSPTKNFHEVDWMEFSNSLKEKLNSRSPACQITSKQEFDSKVSILTLLIQEVIADEKIVPM